MGTKPWHFAFILMLVIYSLGCSKTNTPDPAKIIQVTTTDPTDIEQRVAISGGTISFVGTTTPITAYGVCWSKTTKPTTADYKTVDSLTSDRFISLLTGLKANTTYYVRAYATIAAGTVYGNEFSFNSLQVALPAVVQVNVDGITQTSAESNYSISSDGGSDITSRGICWSTNPNPTTSGSKTINGAAMGMFADALTGLIENTIYYVRPYATNSLGTAYGNELSFTTAIAGINLSLVTQIGSIIPNTDSTMVIGILSPITLLPAVLSYGVCWSESPNPSIADSHSFGSDIKQYNFNSQGRGDPPRHSSDLRFHSPMTGLQSGARYYCRVFVTTSAGTGYGLMTSLIAP
jgi:hypothetical protein